ncbi:MAG: thioredoxin-disulfide reductase [Chloroflexi bacterium]|nr:thioredoxin-disulfide reductase [Chloroflexota bacterium]
MKEYEVVIIGGGPAGLTAGLYASRYGLSTMLIERGLFGGQIINAGEIQNYPGFPGGVSGMDLGQMMYDQASKFGLRAETAEVSGIKTSGNGFDLTVDDETISAKAVIIATGSNYRKMGIDGEERLNGRGISYCATCDGFLFKNLDVAVVGGGDTAVSDALELSQHCKTVYVIHRRDQLRASEIVQRAAFSSERIKFIWNSIVSKLEGQEKLEKVIIQDVKTGSTSGLNVSGVFVAIGLIPNNDLFKGFLELDEAGNVVSNEMMHTSVPGIFTAGDIRKNSPRQVATAVGDGATAAKSAFSYLKER